jgi:mannose-1-phosphate guanylyltransferase
MKAIIFAGGTGRRLWPISRQRSPKQFEPIVGDKSTLQMAVERLKGLSAPNEIFISTNERYAGLIAERLPALPRENIIGEPARRDLAAAVGLAVTHLLHRGSPEDVVAILWGDNTMNDVPTFRRLLHAADELVQSNEADIVFIGETPRFANENLGWIGLGERRGQAADVPYYGFNSLAYRPPLARCKEMFREGTHVWNTGYFVTTLGFVQAAYLKHQPKMWRQLQAIGAHIGQSDYYEMLHRLYPELDEISFDDAVLTHLAADRVVVLHGEMGWSDPGTLYALKEAINADPAANATLGQVRAKDTTDSLLYNYEPDKLLVAIGLEGMIVVNTEDAILVVHKDQIPKVKAVVNSFEDTPLEKYS